MWINFYSFLLNVCILFPLSPPIAMSTSVRNGENQVLNMFYRPFIIDFLHDFLPPPGVGMQVADSSAREWS